MREGFDPQKVKPAALKESAVVDEDESEEEEMSEGLNHSRHWGREDEAEGEGSKAAADGRPRFGSLGDSDVWKRHDGGNSH